VQATKEVLDARVVADRVPNGLLQKDEGWAPFVVGPLQVVNAFIDLAKPDVNQGERVR